MIVHRDLKFDNILILDNQARISDIGLGRLITEGILFLVSRAGISGYVAPEILENMPNIHRNQLFKADAWSLGMIMLELCALKSRVVNIFSSQRETSLAEKRQELGRKYSSESLNLIFGLLKFNPEERVSIEQVQKALSNKFVPNNAKGGISRIEGENELKSKIDSLILEKQVLKNQVFDLKIQLFEVMQANTGLKNKIKDPTKQSDLLQQLNLEKIPILVSENERLRKLIDEKNDIIEEWQAKYAFLLSQNEKVNEIIDNQCKTIEELQRTKSNDNIAQTVQKRHDPLAILLSNLNH